MLEKLGSISIEKLVKGIIEKKEFRQKIVKFNQDRLLKDGTDVDGKKLQTYNAQGGNAYSNLTMNIKRHKGQENKHVTLKDTGAAYATMKTETDNSGFAVSMKDEKEDGKISDNLDLISALGLEDITPLTEIIIPELQKDLLKAILK